MNNRIFKITILATLSVVATAVSGCSTTDNPTNSSGGMAEMGNVKIGKLPFEDASVEEQEQFLEKQRRVRKEQEQELQDLKRQQFYDQYFESRYPTQR